VPPRLPATQGIYQQIRQTRAYFTTFKLWNGILLGYIMYSLTFISNFFNLVGDDQEHAAIESLRDLHQRENSQL
jgi:hypothetical protein